MLDKYSGRRGGALRSASLALALASSSVGGTALAAPKLEITQLPISPELTVRLAEQGYTPPQIEEFLKVIAEIDVYDDHANPANPAGRNNPNLPKVYWVAPYFTPSPTRSVVGAEQFAISALTVLDAIDKTLGSFEFPAVEFQRLTLQRDSVQSKRDKAAATLGQPGLSELQVASLNTYLASLDKELQAVTAQLAAFRTEGGAKAAELPQSLRESIVRSIVLQLSRLGITPAPTEKALLESQVPLNVVDGLAQLRARTGRGQFGLRQAILESGYTEKQRGILRKYFELRPDITTKTLGVTKVYARPVGESVIDEHGKHMTYTAVMQLRGVNIGSQGACGNTRSCNVVLEYTDVGARASTFLAVGDGPTAVLLPVTFAADVSVAQPDFVGSVHCKFKTGWSAQGRADVRDGAIIYDGDLTDQIQYKSIDDPFGGCSFNIQEGSQDSAFYHALMDMNNYYRQLHTERQQDAKRAKDAYEAQIRRELQHQQQNSQRPRGGLFGDVFAFLGGPFGGVVSFLVGETRNFYWHTTILNTSSIDGIDAFQSYNVRNLQATKSVHFDAFPLVCYFPGGGTNGVMKACPDEEVASADTEMGAGQEVCAEQDIFGECKQ